MAANPNPGAIIPPWLENLVKMQFFNECNIHSVGNEHPNAMATKCNMFCTVCYDVPAFCSHCQLSEHDGHQVLQVRRRDKFNAMVRYLDIEEDMDFTDVQKYKSDDLVYLNERPNGKGAHGPETCRNCQRYLKEGYRFCSLGCKNAPRWLENLVNVQFPEQCSTQHGIMFCLDCNNGSGSPFCSNCQGVHEHNGHQLLQIKRFAGNNRDEYAVSASDISPQLRANVQRWKTQNGDDNVVVLFLNVRNSDLIQFLDDGSPLRACEFCKRTVNDYARFCSLRCKLEIIWRNANNAA